MRRGGFPGIAEGSPELSERAEKEADHVSEQLQGEPPDREDPLVDGFEESERALEEQATHGEGGGIPPEDVPAPEQLLDQEFGEADEVVPAEGRPDEGSEG